jgi:hypothetical protein
VIYVTQPQPISQSTQAMYTFLPINVAAIVCLFTGLFYYYKNKARKQRQRTPTHTPTAIAELSPRPLIKDKIYEEPVGSKGADSVVV